MASCQLATLEWLLISPHFTLLGFKRKYSWTLNLNQTVHSKLQNKFTIPTRHALDCLRLPLT